MGGGESGFGASAGMTAGGGDEGEGVEILRYTQDDER